MTTAPQARRRELALIIITGLIAVAATVFAIAAALFMFAL